MTVAAALGIFCVGMWATAAILEYWPALAFFAAAIVLQIAPAETVLSGFNSSTWWLLFGGMVVGNAIRHTGLGKRAGTHLSGLLGKRYFTVISGVALFSLALAFVMPSSMGRIVLLVPIVVSLAEHMGYDSNSNGRIGMLMAAALHQLKTFVAVAREGSITRASERLYLSQPAVSAHIKAIEETLGIILFERTARGMVLTNDGQRLLAKAEQTLGSHRELVEEATRIKGRLTGKLRIGGGSNSNTELVGRLLMGLAERCPEVEVIVQHGTSFDTLEGIRNGSLDAGFYNEPGEPEADLATIEAARFAIYLAAPRGLVTTSEPPDWQDLGDIPWIYPTCGPSCCGHAAENLFRRYQFRPQRTISIDRESVTRTLVAGGVGVGLLHEDTARQAQDKGEVDLICEAHESVRILFAYLASREKDPLLSAASAILVQG